MPLQVGVVMLSHGSMNTRERFDISAHARDAMQQWSNRCCLFEVSSINGNAAVAAETAGQGPYWQGSPSVERKCGFLSRDAHMQPQEQAVICKSEADAWASQLHALNVC